jgi:hypothetical protein
VAWAIAVIPVALGKAASTSAFSVALGFTAWGFLLAMCVAVAGAGAVIFGGVLYPLLAGRIGVNWLSSLGLGAACGELTMATLLLLGLPIGITGGAFIGAAAGICGGAVFHLLVLSALQRASDGSST